MICAPYEKVPVAVAVEIWNEVQAVGAGAPGGGAAGAGLPVTAHPPGPFIGTGSDYVELAGGRWGPGRLARAGGRDWAWQPEISLDSEAFRDREPGQAATARWTCGCAWPPGSPQSPPALRITEAGRDRMLGALEHNGLLALMTRLAGRYGLDRPNPDLGGNSEPVK